MNILKKILFISIAFSLNCNIYAENLLDVYNDAQHSDPQFQQAVSLQLATKTGLPISASALLPSVIFTASPSVTRTGISGTNLASLGGATLAPRNTTTRTYYMALTITQTLFDFNKLYAVRGAYALAKGAEAILNAALQDLMIRTAKLYFNVLRDEDKLKYSAASKRAFKHQLDQVQEQYNVGLKTLTDVDTAKASYAAAVADYINSDAQLSNDRENLRMLTGHDYAHLARLRDDFPLVSPSPLDIERWVETAQRQNWAIKSQRYVVENKKQILHQRYSGHMPVVDMQARMDRNYYRNVNGYNTFNDRNGPGTETDRSVSINITFPIFQGGGVIAKTNQAKYDFDFETQRLEQTIRNTINITRQTYRNIISGISKINADKQAVKSTISSLAGIRENFKVGTYTLVDVLNQQQKVYEKQSQYANDRYNFVNNVLLLKEAAGTLSFDDLKAVNTWLK